MRNQNELLERKGYIEEKEGGLEGLASPYHEQEQGWNRKVWNVWHEQGWEAKWMRLGGNTFDNGCTKLCLGRPCCK